MYAGWAMESNESCLILLVSGNAPIRWYGKPEAIHWNSAMPFPHSCKKSFMVGSFMEPSSTPRGTTGAIKTTIVMRGYAAFEFET